MTATRQLRNSPTSTPLISTQAQHTAVALLLALLPACDAVPRSETANAGAYGGTIVVAGPTDFDFANPLVTGDARTQELNRFLLFMPLVRYGAQLSIEPYLAESWVMHGDTGATFSLRRDVFWHDGRKTSAHDVAFTYERAGNPETGYPNASYVERVTGVVVIDSFRVQLRWQAHADPLSSVALVPIVPRHLLEPIPPAQLRTAAFNRAPVGNGPFRFVSQQANDRWVLEANRDFPRGLGGRPLADRLVWRVIPDRPAQVAELLTGNADLVLIPPAEQFSQLAGRPGIHGIERPSFSYSFIGWNGRRAPFGDARVRRALTMAIDREAILAVLRGGRGDVAVGPVHPNHWSFDRTLPPLPYDPAAARALLGEAGILDSNGDGRLELPGGKLFGFELKFQAGSGFTRDAAEMIQSDLARLGVRVNLRPVDWSALVSDVTAPARKFDAVLMGWEADFRVDVSDLFHSSALDGAFQLAGYSNPRVDELLDRAGRMADRRASLPLWHELQRILRDEQPWTFLYYFPDLLLASDRLAGTEMDLRGTLASAALWRVTTPNRFAQR